MKLLLLVDYFPPFNPGGTEWSVYYLAQAFKKHSIKSQVVTLNYGAPEKEVYEGLEIIRMPFFKKLKDERKVVNPIWQNNPIFFLISTWHLLKIIKREKPDLIHVHGKFLIPAAVISGAITNKPVIVSIRDKQLLCSLGKCFFDKNRVKSCNFFEYLIVDFPWFWQNYVRNKNLISFVYTLLGAIWTRVAAIQIAYFAKKASSVIAISNSQKKYLEANGFKEVITIYNATPFPNIESKFSSNKKVLFVGKLSLGKGARPLLDAVSEVINKTRVKFLFAGSVDAQEEVRSKMNDKIFKRYTKFMGPISHQKLANFYRDSSLVVMPSIYPEAFGRVALEALSSGTPVVVSDRGGLPEIIDDRVTGRVVNVTAKGLTEAIIDILNNEKRYKQNIKMAHKKLKTKFEINPLKLHLKLYNQLLK